MTGDHASITYARQLFIHRHGYPLWFPEPILPEHLDEKQKAWREKGVQIGDVVLITSDGAIDFLFNVLYDKDHPINFNKVPDSFSALQIPGPMDFFRSKNPFDKKTPIVGKDVEKKAFRTRGSGQVPGVPVSVGLGFKLTFSQGEGAALMAPRRTIRYDCRNHDAFKKYAKNNAHYWYHFAYRLGRDPTNGSLYFVTGCDKTSAWEVAACANSSSERKISLNLSAHPVGGGEFGAESSSWMDNGVSRRRSDPKNKSRNQCIFVRGFMVTVSDGLKAWIKRKVHAFIHYPSSHETGEMKPQVRDLRELNADEITHRWRDSSSLFEGISSSPSPSSSTLPSYQSPSTLAPEPRATPAPDEPSSPCFHHDPEYSSSSSSSVDSVSSQVGSAPWTMPVPPYHRPASNNSGDPSLLTSPSDGTEPSSSAQASAHNDSSGEHESRFHPLDDINHILLDKLGSLGIHIIITHDEQLFDILSQDDVEVPDAAKLYTRFSMKYKINIQNDIASLVRKVRDAEVDESRIALAGVKSIAGKFLITSNGEFSANLAEHPRTITLPPGGSLTIFSTGALTLYGEETSEGKYESHMATRKRMHHLPAPSRGALPAGRSWIPAQLLHQDPTPESILRNDSNSLPTAFSDSEPGDLELEMEVSDEVETGSQELNP